MGSVHSNPGPPHHTEDGLGLSETELSHKSHNYMTLVRHETIQPQITRQVEHTAIISMACRPGGLQHDVTM